MATLEIRTPEGIALRAELAGAGSRFAAAMIDGALFVLAYTSLVLLVQLIASAGGGSLSEFLFGLMISGSIVGFVAFTTLSHALWRGQTPGKRALRLRVVTADGYPAGWLALILRSVILPIDALLPLPVPGTIGLASIALTDRRQRLGDLVAGTLVLSEVQAPAGSEPFPGETWSKLEPKTLTLSPGLAARVGGEDVELLRDLLTRAQLPDAHRRELFVGAARHYAQRLELGGFDDARVFLKELYLFLREKRG